MKGMSRPLSPEASREGAPHRGLSTARHGNRDTPVLASHWGSGHQAWSACPGGFRHGRTAEPVPFAGHLHAGNRSVNQGIRTLVAGAGRGVGTSREIEPHRARHRWRPCREMRPDRELCPTPSCPRPVIRPPANLGTASIHGVRRSSQCLRPAWQANRPA